MGVVVVAAAAATWRMKVGSHTSVASQVSHHRCNLAHVEVLAAAGALHVEELAMEKQYLRVVTFEAACMVVEG